MFISLFCLVGLVFSFCHSQNNFVVDGDIKVVKKRSLENVFHETRTCSGESTWDPCGRRCIGPGTSTTVNDANNFRDCAGRCKLDSDYVTEFISRTDCNGTICAPKSLDMKACDSQCYFATQMNQKPSLMCSGLGNYQIGYCLKPSDIMPTTIMDDCMVCYGNGSFCRDCRNTKGGSAKLDVCGVCGGRGDTCGLRVGSIDGSDLIVRENQNITINTNAPMFRPKETTCIYTALTGYVDTKSVLYIDTNNNKVTCLPPPDGDYGKIQIRIKNDLNVENVSNIYEQKFTAATKSSFSPQYLEQSDITISNDVEYASILMGYLFSAVSSKITIICIIQGFTFDGSNVTVNSSRDPYEPRRLKCPVEITPNHPGRNLNVYDSSTAVLECRTEQNQWFSTAHQWFDIADHGLAMDTITLFSNSTGELAPSLSLKLRGKTPNQISFGLSDDGFGFSFTFDQPIDALNVSCQNLIIDSDICKFGANSSCEFVCINQLLITMDTDQCSGQSDSSLAKFGDTIRFKSNGLGKFGELQDNRYNVTQLIIPSDYEYKNSLTESAKIFMAPRGIIVAPQKVRNCGGLMVQLSSLRNQRGIRYQWTMKRNNNTVADYDIAQYLLENSRIKNYLNLNLDKFNDGDQIDLNVQMQNFLTYQTDISHRIQIVNVDIPILEIRPSKDTNNFDVSEGLTLKFNFDLPPCASDASRGSAVIVQWYVTLGSDGSKSTEKELYIAPYTLPGNSNVTVILEGYFDRQSLARSTTQMVIRTKPAILKGTTDGGSNVKLSQINGFNYKINATELKDYFGSPYFYSIYPLQYEWQCDMINETSNERLPCFSDLNAATIFPNAQQKRSDQITLEPAKMFKGYYRMKLKAYDTQKTLTEKYYDFSVHDSDIPLVTFMRNRDNGYVSKENSLSLDAVISYQRNRNLDTSSIKFFAMPFDSMIINCSYPNASAFTQKSSSSSALAYLDLSSSVNVEGTVNQSIVDDGSNIIRRMVRQIISSGKLQASKRYKFVACAKYSDANNPHFGYAVMDIKTHGAIKKLDLNISTSCTGLENFRVAVKYIVGNIDETNESISYQFGLIDSDNTFKYLSDSSSYPSASILCYPTKNYNSVTYAVEACVEKSCRVFRSSTTISVNLQQNINIDDLRRRISEAQADGLRSGRFLNSLTMVNAILQYAQNVQLNSVDMNNLLINAGDVQVQMANETIKNLDGLNVDKLKYLLTASKQIDFSRFTNDSMKSQIFWMMNIFVSKLKNYTQMTDSSNFLVNSQFNQLISSFLSKATFSGTSLLDAQRQIGRLFRNSVKNGNGFQDYFDNQMLVYQRIQKDMIRNKVFKVKPTDSPEIKFPDSLANDYDSVGGVGIQTQYYDIGKNLFSDTSNLASKVLDVTLFDINSGNDLYVANLARPIEILMPNIARQSGRYPTCQFYNEQSGAWSTDGVQTQDSGGTTVTCFTNHLSAFAVNNLERAAPTPAPNSGGSGSGNGNGGGGGGGGGSGYSSASEIKLAQGSFLVLIIVHFVLKLNSN